MKRTYKGHEITLAHESCRGGWIMLYYRVVRLSDNYECACGFTEDESTLPVYMRYMKERLDAELVSANPWDERLDHP